jgi:multidrug transporter EmrE-like cation transporter
MKMIAMMLPTIALVVFSQLAVKWRVQALQAVLAEAAGSRVLVYLSDPWIWLSYGAAFVGGVCWMFVVERYAISLAFPVYIGLTVLCVVLGSVALFGERIAPLQIIAVLLILAGVSLAVRS